MLCVTLAPGRSGNDATWFLDFAFFGCFAGFGQVFVPGDFFGFVHAFNFLSNDKLSYEHKYKDMIKGRGRLCDQPRVFP
jgi:hypothetical protein